MTTSSLLAAATGVTWTGTHKNDTYSGSADDDVLNGLSGNDNLTGNDGNDLINGGHGNDTLDGGDGNDVLNGGVGDDNLYSYEGEDILNGGKGDDQLDAWGWGKKTMNGDAGNDHLLGGLDDDLLDGGADDDWLNGGEGNDTYVFGLGSGNDTLEDYFGENRIQLGVGLGSADITLQADGGELLLILNGSGETLRINYPEYLGAIEFSDGTVWDNKAIFDNAYAPTDGDDDILGSNSDDVLEGLGGDDHLSGYDGNDIIDGGAGDDDFAGGYGDDTYLFGWGSGNDKVWDDGRAGTEGVNHLQLGTGITSSDVTLAFYYDVDTYSDGFALTLNSTGETFKTSTRENIDFIRFEDGTVWDFGTMLNKACRITEGSDEIYGTDGADVIDGLGGDDYIVSFDGNDVLKGGDGQDDLGGGNGNDVLYGGFGNDNLGGSEGNDRVYGNDGDDTLFGEAGNDVLNGGQGNDTYYYAWALMLGQGAGNDRIVDVGGSDTLRLGREITTSDITLSREAGTANMVLTLNATGEELTIRGQYNAKGIESIEFYDGTVWDASMFPSAAAQPVSAHHDWCGMA